MADQEQDLPGALSHLGQYGLAGHCRRWSRLSGVQGSSCFATATNGETEIGNGWYYCELTATEMNADTVIAVLKTTTTNAKTAHMMVHPVEIKELSGAPGFGAGGSGIEEVLSWLMAMSRNKMTQTSSTATLFKDDNSTTLSTASTSDDGTTFTRNKWA